MRPQYTTLTSATTSTPFQLDTYQQDPSASIAVTVTGTLTYSVQYTLDPFFDPNDAAYYANAATCTWFTFSGMSALTASNSISFSAPVIAVRLNVTAWTSGTARFAFVQAGGGR